MKELLKYLGTILLFVLLILTWFTLPIITGYAAKVMCSDIFISQREEKDIMGKDLGYFPFNLCRFKISYKDSSVIASIGGMAINKAIYQNGFGSKLINNGIKNKLINPSKVINIHSINQKHILWPEGDSIPFYLPDSINHSLLNKVINNCFKHPWKGKSTRAVLVIYKGQILVEKYAPGFNENSILTGWSMAKGITNALLAILVNKKLLDIHKKPVFEEWRNDIRNKITIEDLMHMSSGLDWSEFYAGPSDVTRMLFRENDMGGYAKNKKSIYDAGSHFYYSSGTANILSLKIRDVLGDSIYSEFPYKELFHKIGMQHTILETDASGTFVGSSYCYATARDWGRFGLLFENDGVWKGERILPEGWVRFSTETDDKRNDQRWGKYGALWWVNAGDKNNHRHRRYRDVPEDCYSAMGFEGQSLWIIPSKNLVIVRLSCEHDHLLDGNAFLADIIKACNKN